jgi:hypothetical protein
MDKYQRDMQFTRIYVGGKWCPPTHDDSIPVIDAARDEVMGRIPDWRQPTSIARSRPSGTRSGNGRRSRPTREGGSW